MHWLMILILAYLYHVIQEEGVLSALYIILAESIFPRVSKKLTVVTVKKKYNGQKPPYTKWHLASMQLAS